MNSVYFRPIFEILEGKGPLTSTGIEALLYMKTNNSINADPEHPDIELLQSFATVAFDTGSFLFILFFRFLFHRKWQRNSVCNNKSFYHK